MARPPSPSSAAAFISQPGAPGAGARNGPRADRKEMRVLGPPRLWDPGSQRSEPPRGLERSPRD